MGIRSPLNLSQMQKELKKRVKILSHLVYACTWLKIMANNVTMATTALLHRRDIISMSNDTLRLVRLFVNEENVISAREGTESYCVGFYDAYKNSSMALIALWRKEVDAFETDEILLLISNYKETLPDLEKAARETHKVYSMKLESMSLTPSTQELINEMLSNRN